MAPAAAKPKNATKSAPSKPGKKPTKEKVFHPNASSKRGKNLVAKDVSSLSLPEIHDIIQSVWLTRHDGALQAEQSSRRPGRPPSARELALLEMKRQDEEVYRTGLTIPDLTDPETITLFRAWEDKSHDPAYLHLLRSIRVSRENPETVVLEHVGAKEADARRLEKAAADKEKVDQANREASRKEADLAARDVSKMDVD
ncbi:Translation machinery-associated protein 16 [Rhizoctonia solani]|uniref:Translation machinery-associated protein 16 n=1 Tax=Rhizoctonia solani TaxID=456999 RepID=A0A8H7IHL9_9AGAM|nr:Translation machinery-associated protein 16 [Rhizoctonia solani]